jgi:AcrR family transcriptional regulator
MPSKASKPSESPDLAATAAIDAQRREPFGNSPAVGLRGKATQQRLLGAALEVFGELGYHQTSVEAITERAGCSRPTLYQYFKSKDDLFRQLAGQLGIELGELIDNLDAVDGSPAGVAVMRDWFAQVLEVHDRYRPIFDAFSASLRRDPGMVSGAAVLAGRYGKALARALRSPLPASVATEDLASLVMVTVFGSCTFSTHTDLDRQRVVVGLADNAHRAIFGRIAGTNMAPAAAPGDAPKRSATLHQVDPADRSLRPKGERTRALLLASAAKVFSDRGYQATRVDDIVELASLSHGAFYRYFVDKEAIFSELAIAAASEMLDQIEELPVPAAGLEDWSRRYYATYAEHGELFSMWPEAYEAGVGTGSMVERAVSIALREILGDRTFGDIEADRLFLFALLEGGPRSTTSYGALSAEAAAPATAVILERSLLP